MALLVLISILWGWVAGFKNNWLVFLFTIIIIVIALYYEDNYRKLFFHIIIINAVALLASSPFMFCILRYDAFNPFSDTFTYLVHGQWLQSHAFKEPALLSGYRPAMTQVALYQGLSLRMGSSFFLGWAQALFQSQWSYTVFPAVASLGVATGSLAVGYGACLAGFRRKWHGITIAILTAVSFNGLASGSVFGFFPQTFGLTFAVAFMGLFGAVFTQARRIKKRDSALFCSLPLALLFSALVYSYSELAPFTVIATLLTGGVYIILFSTRKQLLTLCSFFLLFCFLFLNVQIFKAIKAILAQSKAIVGWPVLWSNLDFIGHCFGLRSTSGDPVTWLFNYKFICLAFLLLSILLLILLGRKVFKRGFLELLPCLTFIIVCLAAFLYFRYAVSSPWENGIGQTWSQFKISEWSGPFCIIFLGCLFIYGLKTSRICASISYSVLFICIAFGIIHNFNLADSRTKPIRMETGYNQEPFRVFLDLREHILYNIKPDQCLYLDLGGRHHKLRQMFTYFLPDINLGGAWHDDGYFCWLPSAEQNIPMSKCEYLLEFKGRSFSTEKGDVFGNLKFNMTPTDEFRLLTVKGGYPQETDNFSWWHWTKAYLTFKFEFMGKSLPEKAILSFQCLSMTSAQNSLIVSGEAQKVSLPFTVRQGWNNIYLDIPVSGSKLEIKITSPSSPVPISDKDSRFAKFLIKNLEIRSK
jgi:hypothetical protein